MTDKKFSEFVAKPAPLSTDEVVGFSGGDNIRIPVSSLTGEAGTITSVDGTAPISVDNTTDPAVPVVSISNATTSADGAMSSTDKIRLDSLPSSPVTGVTGVSPIEIDITNPVVPAISIDAATTSLPGSMSAADKEKLDNLGVGTLDLNIIFKNLEGKADDFPILIECTGQSNMTGRSYETTLAAGTTFNDKVFDFRMDTAVDPQPLANACSFAAATLEYDSLYPSPGTDSGTGGAWTGMVGETSGTFEGGAPIIRVANNIGWSCCDIIQKATGRDVYMVQTHYSGESINKWMAVDPDASPPAAGVMYTLRNARVSQAIAELVADGHTGIEVSAVIWCQGGSDRATPGEAGVVDNPQDYTDKWLGIQTAIETWVDVDNGRIGWATPEQTRYLITQLPWEVQDDPTYIKKYSSIHDYLLTQTGPYVQAVNSQAPVVVGIDGFHWTNQSLAYMGERCGYGLLAPPQIKQSLRPSAQTLTWKYGTEDTVSFGELQSSLKSTATELHLKGSETVDTQDIKLFNEKVAADDLTPQDVTVGGQSAHDAATAGNTDGGALYLKGGDHSTGDSTSSGGDIIISGGSSGSTGNPSATLITDAPYFSTFILGNTVAQPQGVAPDTNNGAITALTQGWNSAFDVQSGHFTSDLAATGTIEITKGGVYNVLLSGAVMSSAPNHIRLGIQQASGFFAASQTVIWVENASNTGGTPPVYYQYPFSLQATLNLPTGTPTAADRKIKFLIQSEDSTTSNPYFAYVNYAQLIVTKLA